ncbi:hypothetical protein OG772_20285 [Streptomyces sp. NBC_01321]|uniref:hypothetical protein n=1 Tax=Streptomyces sp. NBC_01321 TaxID=2903825 RepID=UPI002E0DC58A|nr:hypothetical protein OG772_20285 [Streptomyces sp. NBC_01321]
MTDTDQQQPADAASPLIETRVCIDDMLGPYDAKLNPDNRWNGWLSPFFTLDTARKIAARTQEMADEDGHDCVDTIHVIDGGIDREGEPRAVVLHISWQYFDEGSQTAASIIQPNDEGLYGIGGWSWTWHFATWSCTCGADEEWHVTRCECGLPRPEDAADEAAPDVAHARCEDPIIKPEPKRSGPGTWDLREIAEDAARTIPSDVTSHDANEIAQMVSGLVAAVLYVADTVARVNDRP